MNKTELRNLQLVQLDILKEIKRVCNEAGITYTLSSGTLLGAIRHNGFIPWDDDLDVDMPRKSYDKFLNMAPLLLREEYELQTWHNDALYANPYAKVVRKGTTYAEITVLNTKNKQEIFVDVFPWDNYPCNRSMRIYQGLQIEFFKRLLRAKCGYQMWRGGRLSFVRYIGYLPLRFIGLFAKKENLIKRYEIAAVCCDRHNSHDLFMQGIFRYGSHVIPKKTFKKTVEHVFENDVFPVPVEYDIYLKVFYGDYMKLPPREERYNRHRIIELSFPEV